MEIKLTLEEKGKLSSLPDDKEVETRLQREPPQEMIPSAWLSVLCFGQQATLAHVQGT